MRFHVAVCSILFLILLAEQAWASGQPTKIDTLIIEPAQAADLPKAVITWLERRDFLIPVYGESGYKVQYGNTLIGSFTGENTKDCAVLTIPRGALEDRFSLWVFPAGDTLAPMLIDKHRVFHHGGTQWQQSYDNKSVLEYRWCIRPYGPYSEADLKKMVVATEGLPEISHQGIFVLLAEKDPYPFYYYDGKEWLLLPLGQ